MVGAGVGAGAGAGLGTGKGGIGGILILNRRRRLPVHPSAKLDIIPIINITIKRDANFVIFTLKKIANDYAINYKAFQSRYVSKPKLKS